MRNAYNNPYALSDVNKYLNYLKPPNPNILALIYRRLLNNTKFLTLIGHLLFLKNVVIIITFVLLLCTFHFCSISSGL